MFFIPLLLLICVLVAPAAGYAVSVQEAERTADLLAALLDAGRMVVDQNEGLIDDPHKGPKGFTPDVFGRQVADEFARRTGIDLGHIRAAAVPTLAKELLPLLFEAEKQVVADAQVIINQRGIGYKNFIPATFASHAATKFSNRSQVRLKQTTLNPRNPRNAPDAYETAILKAWTATGVGMGGSIDKHSETIENDGRVRILMPLRYHRHCLSCHGEPAGQLDVSGFPKEGAKEGDLAGAISITIPLDHR